MNTIQQNEAAFISAVNVCKQYGNEKNTISALKEITLSVKKGEFAMIMGPSGCGKSTLLHILGGVDKPDSGCVVVGGIDISSASEKVLTVFRKNTVGFIYQFHNLLPDLTAKENVALVASSCRNALDVDAVMAKVGLADRINHFPSQLSGGQQQRVSIARAIVKQPSLLLCDEPTGALDSKSGKTVLEMLEHYCRVEGKTILMVTHNQAVLPLADHVMMMKDGVLVEEIFNSSPKSVAELDL